MNLYFQWLARMEVIALALQSKAGQAADLVGQVKEAAGSLEQLLRDIEAGTVFNLSVEVETKLDELEQKFEALCEGGSEEAPQAKAKKSKGAKAQAEAQLDPVTIGIIGRLALELFKLWRSRR